MSFELHPSVETDLEKASDYYLKKAGRVIASRFLEEFYRAAVYLAANPEIVSQAADTDTDTAVSFSPAAVGAGSPLNVGPFLVVKMSLTPFSTNPLPGTRKIDGDEPCINVPDPFSLVNLTPIVALAFR